jgi:uncharacterized protein YgbK (DUF1537 family)
MFSMIDALILADDLTGACDAAVAFRHCGMKTVVSMNTSMITEQDGEILGLSTESRDLRAVEAEERIRSVATSFQQQPRVLFKKIDSMLRGNPGWEIRATLDAFGCDVAIITPAFPKMHRTVKNGLLYVGGERDWQPLDVKARFESQGLKDLVQVQPEAVPQVIGQGHRYISVDAACDGDLEWMTRVAMEFGKRILWAGAAGLAAAVAAQCVNPDLAAARSRRWPLTSGKPVLFCIGTSHGITVSQVSELLRQRRCHWCDGVRIPGQIDGHLILRIPSDADPGELTDHLARVPETFGAVLLSGGRTAAQICQALGITKIALEGEIVTGLPWGIPTGGPWENLAIATKSGAFGERDALIRVADFFSCTWN